MIKRCIFILLTFLLLNATAQAQSSKDEKETFSLNMKKAKKGDAEAQRLVAFAYENGTGVKQNGKKALEWFGKAAEGGDMQAQVRLADRLSANGHPNATAAAWYRKAADQGSMEAQRALGKCYNEGYGVRIDTTEAFNWFLKAAEQGDLYSQKEVGADYYEGTGTTRDYDEAFKWYMKAAEQGDSLAQNMVGAAYADGKGAAKDMTEAVKWYKLSAEKGNHIAQTNLAVCYINGEGVAKDVAEGARWMEKAAAQGDATAKKWLAEYNQAKQRMATMQSWLNEVKEMKTHASAYIYGEPREGEAKPIKIWQKTKNGYFYNGPKCYGFCRFGGEYEGYSDPYVSCLPQPYSKCTFTVNANTIKFTFEDAIQTDCQFKRVKTSWGGESDAPTKPRDFMRGCLGCKGGTSSFVGYVYTEKGRLKIRVTNNCTHKIYQTPRTTKLRGHYSNGASFTQGALGTQADPFAPWRSVHNQTTTINLAESAKLNGMTKKELATSLLGCEKWLVNRSGQPYSFDGMELKVMFYFLWNTFGFSMD